MVKLFEFNGKKKPSKKISSSNSNPSTSSPTFFSSYALTKKGIHESCDFEQWYKKLKAYTFPSEIIPMDKPTAIAFTHYYREYMLGFQGSLTKEDELNIANIQRITASILEKKFNRKEVFVRMSNRSPKDGIAVGDLEQSGLHAYQEIEQTAASDNDKLTELTDLQMKNLRCSNTQEIFNLLLTSERIYIDLLEAIDCSTSEDDVWSTHIILREWEPELRQKHEFRLFVYHNKVTAISQYNPYCYYPWFDKPETREQIVKTLTTFAKEIGPLIDIEHYILDLALIEGRVIVIELNPFHHTTGPCLFSWQSDEAILKGNTTVPMPVLRVQQEPPKDQARWIKLIVNQQKEYIDKADNFPYFKSHIQPQ